MTVGSSAGTCALLSNLLMHASHGESLVEFFGSVSQLLLDVTQCDALELSVREPLHTCRCTARRADPGAFRFRRQPHSEGAAPLAPQKGGQPDSAARIALVAGADELGTLQLGSEHADFFTPDRLQRFEQMAEALSIALVHQRAQWVTRERVKELTCLYSIAQLAEGNELPLEQVLRRASELVPSGWQYPEITTASITLDGVCYRSGAEGAAVHTQSEELLVGDERRGDIVVSYTRPCPAFDEGPFLQEERRLLTEVARQLAATVKRRQTEEDRSRLQEQLRHADRLATIGQLAAGVAHELNEPLGAVLGFAQLARKAPRLPKQAAQDVDRIVRAALHAREVVRKLMVFGRKTPARKSELDLNRLVEEGIEVTRPRCESEGVRLVCRLAPGLPPVAADPTQLHQVLVNLVVNAMQAMQAGGTILVATSCNAGHVRLTVEDSGPGMPKEVLEQIFLPFFTTKGPSQGTGLGLCVVQDIVTSHKGTIRVDSKPGEGTVFEVCLPATSPTQDGSQPP